MKHEKKKRVALVLFGLVVAGLIIEGSLRFLGWGLYFIQEKQNRESVSLKDAQRNRTGGIQLRLAEGKEIVILCVGESTTFGGMTNSWPRQLQRILNNIQDQRIFRVVNRGIPGITTKDLSEKLPEFLSSNNPDLVLAMVGINDIFDKPLPEKTSPSQPRWTTLLSHFRTYDLIEWIAAGIRVLVTGKTDDVATDNAGEGGNSGKSPVYGLKNQNVTHLHPETIKNINDMANLTIAQGINFIIVQYALRKTDILRNVIEQNKVIYISNYEIFTGLLAQYSYEDLFWDRFAGDFGHATPFGNRAIAENVAQQLLKLFELQ